VNVCMYVYFLLEMSISSNRIACMSIRFR
jgi:hypothetical protein